MLNKRYRFLALAVTAFLAAIHGKASPVESAEPAARPFWVRHLPQDDTTELTVHSRAGQIQWSHVLQALMAAEELDQQAVAGLLPSGTFSTRSLAASAILIGMNVAFDGAARFEIRNADQPNPTLVVTLRRDVARDKLRALKSRVRNRVALRWKGAKQPYSMELDDNWQSAGQLVLLIHGYTSRPSSLASLRTLLRADGFVTAAFGYPNDGPIEPSGVQLSHAIADLHAKSGGRKIYLVCHSMGGLVARVALEMQPVERTQQVKRLITIATPHNGSSLARIPCSTDAWEAMLRGKEASLADFFIDGLNEARDDLRPESRLMRRLKTTKRRPDVAYSVIQGDRGFLPPAELAEVKQKLQRLANKRKWLELLGPKLDRHLNDLDEIVAGKGDGVVSLQRGRLQGVDDVEVLPFHHWAATDAMTQNPKLYRAIQSRLTTPPVVAKP